MTAPVLRRPPPRPRVATPVVALERHRAQSRARTARYRERKRREAAPDKRAVDRALADAACEVVVRFRDFDDPAALARTFAKAARAALVHAGYDGNAAVHALLRRTNGTESLPDDPSMGQERLRRRRNGVPLA